MAEKTNSSTMQKRKQLKIRTPQTSRAKNWLQFINDDSLRYVIPVGPRFQADVSNWTGPPDKRYPRSICDNESGSSKWLGTRIWPIEGINQETKEGVVGKGRPEFCLCISPGLVECIKRHVTDKTIQLQLDLGPAFWRWKFDEMGEEVSKLWTSKEQKRFESLVKMNPISQGKSFLKPALECLPSQCKQTIVSYYFNVYVPRRMSLQNRSGCTIVDTDDEAGEAPYSNGSRKRCRANNHASYTSKYVKTRYLTGRR